VIDHALREEQRAKQAVMKKIHLRKRRCRRGVIDHALREERQAKFIIESGAAVGA
jgi:hypothetical protein